MMTMGPTMVKQLAAGCDHRIMLYQNCAISYLSWGRYPAQLGSVVLGFPTPVHWLVYVIHSSPYARTRPLPTSLPTSALLVSPTVAATWASLGAVIARPFWYPTKVTPVESVATTGSARFHSDRVLECVQLQVWPSAHVPQTPSAL